MYRPRPPLPRAHAGSAPWELPECLLGAARWSRLDCNTAVKVDWTKELPWS